MPPAPFAYPLDPTGTSPGNLITNEVHTLVPRKERAIAPFFGAFFADSVIVIDVANNQPLSDTQFYVSERYGLPTVLYNDDICAIIVVTDATVSNNVKIQYQALGGIYQKRAVGVLQQYNATDDVDRPAHWGRIFPRKIDWPKDDLRNFSPVSNGFETTVQMLGSIAEAIERGDDYAHDGIRTYIKNELSRLAGNAELSIQELLANHVSKSDPHPDLLTATELSEAMEPILKPVNIQPIPGANNIAYLNVLFSLSAYRALYAIPQSAIQFQVSTSDTFATLVIDQTVNGTGDSYTAASGLAHSTQYYWRARYQSVDGAWSNWSDSTTFITAAVYIQPPVITAPTQDQQLSSPAPTITTDAMVAVGATDTHQSTDWEIWTGPNGTGARVYQSANNSTSKTSLSLPAGILTVSGTYYLRVRFTGANLGLSNWSGDRKFTTASSFFPSVIGESFGGGYFAGNIDLSDGRYAVILAPKAMGETTTQLQTNTDQFSGAYSDKDSVANTYSMFYAGASFSPAAVWARQLSINSYGDWQIPAKDLMSLVLTNLSPSNPATPALFKTGGSEAMAAAKYWTSTLVDWVRDDSYDDPKIPNYDWVTSSTPFPTTFTSTGVIGMNTNDANSFPSLYSGLCNSPTSWPEDAWVGDGLNTNPPAQNPYPSLHTGGTWADGSQPDPPYLRVDFGADYAAQGYATRYRNYTYYICNYGNYFYTKTISTWTVVSYTDGAHHTVFTQLYQAWTVAFDGTGADKAAKTDSYRARAVRLIKVS